MHASPSELQQMLSEAKGLELGSPAQLRALEALRVGCPAFVPGLLTLSRAILWGKEDLGAPAPFFDEVERILRDAAHASGREPAALVGLARFASVIRDSPQAAESLYREAIARSLEILEEAWAGLIEALGEQEKTEEAARTADLAGKVFPRSAQLAEARRFAKIP